MNRCCKYKEEEEEERRTERDPTAAAGKWLMRVGKNVWKSLRDAEQAGSVGAGRLTAGQSTAWSRW